MSCNKCCMCGMELWDREAEGQEVMTFCGEVYYFCNGCSIKIMNYAEKNRLKEEK